MLRRTDHGEVLGWLRMQSIRGRLSRRQRRMVDDVCLTVGVELYRLVLRCEKPERIIQTINRPNRNTAQNVVLDQLLFIWRL